jgi:hypothetical protein
MRNPDVAIGARLAGALLVAMPFLDVIAGVRDPGPVHAIVGFFGLALLAADAAKTIAKEA